jgi:hypothetical protein
MEAAIASVTTSLGGGSTPTSGGTVDVAQLEQELATTRQAFEDYVVSTQDLESGMDEEIKDMRKLALEIF